MKLKVARKVLARMPVLEIPFKVETTKMPNQFGKQTLEKKNGSNYQPQKKSILGYT
jgi:hypothetical protein